MAQSNIHRFPSVPNTVSNNTVVVDDGTREFVLTNRYGKTICKLHFRAGDMSILDRYNDLMKEFPTMVQTLSNINLENDGTTSFDKDWATLKKVEGVLKQKINQLFDMDEADEIFASRNPFSSIGGKFFIEHVLDALGKLVEQTSKEEAELAKKRTDKYLKDIDDAERPEVMGGAGATPTNP